MLYWTMNGLRLVLIGVILVLPIHPVFGYHQSSTRLFAKKGRVPVKNALTPAQRILNQQKKEPDEAQFDKFKSSLYDFSDNLSTLSDKLSKGKKPTIKEGYKDRKAKANPTLRILENLQKPRGIEEPPPSSALDSMKNAIYGTADRIKSVQTKQSDSSSKQPTSARLERSKEVLAVLPDLQDPNPIKRLSAEWKIKDLEFKENVREKQQQVANTIDNIKTSVYSFVDFVRSSISFLQKLPARIQNGIRKFVNFVEAVPGAVEETVDTVTSIPARVEQKTEEIQTGVTETIKKTKQTIDDVKAIPSKVKQNVETTKENVKSAVNTVEEVSTNVKVLLGLEKPAPKPPKKPPPKPSSGADIAMDVLGKVASGVGKAAWWVGKGTAGLAFKAAKAGVEKAKEQATKKMEESRPSNVATPATGTKAPSSPPRPKDVSDLKPSDLAVEKIDAEVSEALKLAKQALEEKKDKVDEAGSDKDDMPDKDLKAFE